MADFTNLKADFNAGGDHEITTNGNQQITGARLNYVLNEIVDNLGKKGYQYAGIAHPSDAAIATDSRLWYLATEAGTYTNKGGIIVNGGEVAILKYDTSWHKDITEVANNEYVGEIVGYPLISIEGKSRATQNRNNVYKLKGGVDYNISFESSTGISSARALPEQVFLEARVYPSSGGASKLLRAWTGVEGFEDKHMITYTPNTDCELAVYESWHIGEILNISVQSQYSILAKTDGINGAQIEHIGDQNNGSATCFKLVPLARYEVVLPVVDWDMTGVSRGQNKFSIGYRDYNGNAHDIYSTLVGSMPASSYIIKAIDAECYYIFNRAAKGEKVYFEVIPVGGLATKGLNISLSGEEIPNIDTINGLLDLGSDPNLYIGDKVYGSGDFDNVDDYRAIVIQGTGDSQDSSRRKLVFNLDTKKFSTKNYDGILSSSEVPIGSFVVAYSTSGYKAGSFKWATLPFQYTIDGKPLWDDTTGNIYDGDPLPIGHRYHTQRIFQLSEIGTPTYPVDTQGMDVFENKYLFQGNHENSTSQRSIYVIDMESRTLLGSILYTEMGNWHMNNINCANKENSADKFPLLYLSECAGEHRCAVIKINDAATSYQIKQIITFSTTQHYSSGTQAFDWFIDLDNSWIYCYGKPISAYGPIEIVKFNMPSLDNASVELTDNDVIDSFIVNGMGVGQGSKLVNGKLICPVGFGNAQWPAYIKVIDLERKRVVTSVPWSFGEPEAAAIYNDGLLIVNNASNPTYRLLTI